MRCGISTIWRRVGILKMEEFEMDYDRSPLIIILGWLIIHPICMVLGLYYVRDVLWDLLGGDPHKSAAIRLGEEVKESIIEFIGQIRSDRLYGDWWFSFPGSHHPSMERYLPYSSDPHFKSEQQGYMYTSCVMVWHTATWYLEQAATAGGGRGENEEISRNRRVAIALSKYCTYLVASAPELIPGPAPEVSRAYSDFVKSARVSLLDRRGSTNDYLRQCRTLKP